MLGLRVVASLHFAESFLFFFLHNLVHFFCFPPLQALFTLFGSFLVHFFLSLSAVHSFGDGAGAVPSARRTLISGSTFAVSTATSRVVDGATAPTQLSTLSAASRNLKSGTLIICVDHVRFGLLDRISRFKGPTA